MAYVYAHIRLDKNEVFYIGIGFDMGNKYKRAYSYGRNNLWEKIVKKTDYKVVIIEDNLEDNVVYEREIYWIKKYGRLNNNSGTLSNLTDGGEATLGWIPSEETKKKIGNSNRGKIRSDEHKLKISKALTGHKNNKPEVRKKISEKHKANKNFKIRGLSESNLNHLKRVAELNKGKPSWNKGLNKDTNPILKKIGEKLKGRISTFKGHSHSFETKILLSEKAKKREKIECEYCKKKVTSGNLKRWHGENCKSKKINRLDNNFW